jgi:hypothetical protein
MNEKRIGVVNGVQAGTLEVLLDKTVSSLVRELNGKVYLIGQIGTYVLIPVARLVMIGMVTEFKKTDVAENGQAVQRYVMTVNLVGTVKQGKFERGVSIIPPVEAPVYFAEDSDLNVVFSVFRKSEFSVGGLSLFEKERAFLEPNKFFGKHIAILGSSGAGKSCTVSSLLQKVSGFPDTNIIILDIHNEYSTAFPVDGQHLNVAELELPYWLMSFDEMVEVFIDPKDEHSGSQTTVLKDLITESKRGKNPELSESITIDTPVTFDLNEVRAKMQFLDSEKISGLGASGSKDGPFYGKFSRFLVRLDSRLNDPRYAFIFRPKKFKESPSMVELLELLFGKGGSAKVTLLDLSGVPFDVVNTIVSILARMAFELNFWNPNRREFPILLVCEEAHNYLPSTGEARAARKTMERIAKEGRKYGVSCMIVSQRPTEVSETILAQCGNFVILRLTNPVDQAFVRKLLPDTFAGLVESLPSLRQGESLIVGDAMPMPMRVQIDFPNPEPQSADIKFFDKWKKSEAPTNLEHVINRWRKQERH